MKLTILVTFLTVEKAPAFADALSLLLSNVKQMHKRNIGLRGPVQVFQISLFLKD